jgi:putative SOS response-associated peptidase YedK
MINAREETLMEKPSFKRPFISKRCLVPVSGFYEWKHLGNEKTPYFIRLKNAELFSLAGLYETWTDVEERSQLSFTIITTGPNTLMQSIHDRMPVIIPAERESEWLDPANKNPESLHKLLIPYAADQMFAYPVSALVNNPENDSRDLMREIK